MGQIGAWFGRKKPIKPYLSCHHLERGLVFWPQAVTACCANPATGETPIVAPFTGELGTAAILDGRREIIARHKTGDIVPECRGCPRLTQGTWQPEDGFGYYPIDDVTIAHFTTCNIRCNYCYTVNRPDLAAPLSKAPRVLKTFEKLIADRTLAPYATIRFSGGEPTLLPEFEALLTLLTDYGARCIVYTNAVIRSQAILDALRRDKVELILGIDAVTRETYRAIKKMDYNETVWKTVAAYAASAVAGARNKVWAKFIFCEENYREAEAFVARVAKAGIRHVYYDFDASRGRGEGGDRAHLGPLPEEIVEYTARLRRSCAAHRIEVEFAQAGLAWLTPEREAAIEIALAAMSGEEQFVQAK
jgi:organic radical activating enzyme